MLMSLFGNLLSKQKSEEVEKLQQQVKLLTKQLHDCDKKLREKQEHINKTNAYWKNKMKELVQSKKKKY